MSTQSILLQLKNIAKADNVPIMLDDSLDLLLKTLKDHQPKKILEIGTAIGYSGLAMLDVCPGATLTTIELDEDRYITAQQAFRNAGEQSRVNAFLGDCTEIVRLMEGKFDFIMLDGPKGHYFDMLYYLDKLLLPCGIIFADNILFKGKVEGESYPQHKHRTIVNSLRSFIDSLQHSTDYQCILAREGDGIIIAHKRSSQND